MGVALTASLLVWSGVCGTLLEGELHLPIHALRRTVTCRPWYVPAQGDMAETGKKW